MFEFKKSQVKKQETNKQTLKKREYVSRKREQAKTGRKKLRCVQETHSSIPKSINTYEQYQACKYSRHAHTDRYLRRVRTAKK